MTDISSAAAAAAIRSAGDGSSGDPPTVSEPTNGLTADFETFLRLLTTQMQNQDPLQPMESTEFVSQLAQFSAVEQQVATNKQLEQILDTLSGGDAGQLAEWLQREVRADAPAVYAGDPLQVYPAAPELDAATAALVVRDKDGAVVAEAPFEPGAETVTWDGTTAEGGEAAPGVYAVEARYATPAGATETAPVESFARVVEARRGEAGVELVLEGGGVVDADTVSGVR